MKRPLLTVCFVASLAVATLAQEKRSSDLFVSVVDQTGNSIVASEILATAGLAAPISGSPTTTPGEFRFEGLSEAKYTLTVLAEGFAPAIRVIQTPPGRVTRLRVMLTVRLTERVEVNSRRISSDPRGSLSSFTLVGKDLDALPDDPQLLLQRLREMAGSRNGQLSIYVDGLPLTRRLPPKATIEMIRVNADPFSAEFAEPGRNRVEITTKPGVPEFHGELKFLFRDRSLTARNAFAPTKPPFQYRNYDGYLGGPVIPNHWGFLVYGGRWEQDENAVIHATVLDHNGTAYPFGMTAATPTRVNSGSISTDFEQRNQRINLSFSASHENKQNQGLDGGLSLPEHAINSLSNQESFQAGYKAIGRSVFNDFHVEIGRTTSEARALASTPSIVVFDAFNAGGNPGGNVTDSNRTVQIAESLLFVHQAHTLKLGLQGNTTRLDNVDRSGFIGTFTFGSDFERDENGRLLLGDDGLPITITPIEHYRRTLLGLAGYGPSQFSLVRGDPAVKVSQWQAAWFVQDDWAVSKRFTLSYGLRQQLQQDVAGQPNFAPRVAMALVPDKQGKSAMRIGAGIFYNPIDTGLIFDATRLDGRHQQELTFQNPAFFWTLPDAFDGAATPLPVLHTLSPNLRVPRSILGTVSYERQLPARLFGSVELTWRDGRDLLRMRNVNAPIAGSDAPQPSDVGTVLQYESTGRSTTRELVFSLSANITKSLSLYSNYTLGRTRSDTDGAYTTPADSHDLSNEFGWAGNDMRHQFSAGGSIPLPGGINLSPSISITSGAPFNITTGRDNNNDTLFTDRPAFAKAGDPGAITTRFGVFNPNPQPGDVVIPRNFGRGPGQVNISFHLSKSVKHGLIFSADVANAINRTNLTGINGVVTSPAFGKPNQALDPLRVELSVQHDF